MRHWTGAVASSPGESHRQWPGELAAVAGTSTCSGWSRRWQRCQRCSLFGSWCFAGRSCWRTGWASMARRNCCLGNQRNDFGFDCDNCCSCSHYCIAISWVSQALVGEWHPLGGLGGGQLGVSSLAARDRKNILHQTCIHLSPSSTCMESSCS